MPTRVTPPAPRVPASGLVCLPRRLNRVNCIHLQEIASPNTGERLPPHLYLRLGANKNNSSGSAGAGLWSRVFAADVVKSAPPTTTAVGAAAGNAQKRMRPGNQAGNDTNNHTHLDEMMSFYRIYPPPTASCVLGLTRVLQRYSRRFDWPLQDIVLLQRFIVGVNHPCIAPPTCKAYPIVIRLHDHYAIYPPLPTPPLYAIHHTILVMAISRKGQSRSHI